MLRKYLYIILFWGIISQFSLGSTSFGEAPLASDAEGGKTDEAKVLTTQNNGPQAIPQDSSYVPLSEPDGAKSPTPTIEEEVDHPEGLRVFLDCGQCDVNFMRTELTFVNFVRDPMDAQVHILATSRRTGSGGREHTLFFIGGYEFTGKNDTLLVVANNDDTADDLRVKLMKKMTLGLAPYVARTPLGDQLTVRYAGRVEPKIVNDNWDHWVFRISASGRADGETTRQNTTLRGSLSARRITEDWKMSLWASKNYYERNWTIKQDTTSDTHKQVINTNENLNGSIIKSLTNHWSAGIWLSNRADTYDNFKRNTSASGAIEYNIFPYSASNYRELRIEYRLGVADRVYNEETIYNKLAETLTYESLELSLSIKDRWGSARVSLDGSHYFHDFSKSRMRFSYNLDFRLYKGLSLDINGNFQAIQNQLSLSKGGDSDEDVLLAIKAQQTNFRYWVNMGISYTFGSIYSSVVNPRFGG